MNASTQVLHTDEARGKKRYLEKRSAIMEAAARIFNQRGLRGGTLTDVAASVGLATNSVTYYFRKKEELVAACLLQSISVLIGVIAKAKAEATLEERIGTLFSENFRLLAAIECGEHPTLMHFSDIRALRAPHADAVLNQYTELVKAVRGLLVLPGGCVPKEQLHAATYHLISMFQWARACIGFQVPANYQWVAKQMAMLTLHGIAASGQPWGESSAQEKTWLQTWGQFGSGDALLQAATRLINDEGYHGASIDRIAAHLQLTKGAFYSQHDTKLDLVAACFERTSAITRSAISHAVSMPTHGLGKALAICRMLAAFQLSEHGPILRAYAVTALPDVAHQQQVRLERQRFVRTLANLLVDGMQDGSVRQVDADTAAYMLIATVDTANGLPRWSVADQRTVGDLYVKRTFFGLLSTLH